MATANVYISTQIDSGVLGFDLSNLVKQIQAHKGDYDTISVNLINCIGGNVDTGLDIIEYLKSTGKRIDTHAVGIVASMGSVIHSIGESRTMDYGAVLMLHNPRYTNIPVSEAKDLENKAVELRELESVFAEYYTAGSNLSKEDVLSVMGSETYMDQDEALEKGFITQSSAKIQAKLTINQMNMSGLTDRLKALFNQKTEPKAQALEVNTVTNETIVFNSKEANYHEGDEATIAGMPAEGTFAVKEGKEELTFEKGKLTGINEKAETMEIPEVEALIVELREESNSKIEAKNLEINEREAKIEALALELEEANKKVTEVQAKLTEKEEALKALNGVKPEALDTTQDPHTKPKATKSHGFNFDRPATEILEELKNKKINKN